MLRTDVLVPQAFGLFRGEVQDTLGLLAEGNLDGGGDALTNRDALLDLLADGFDGPMGTQESIGQSLILAHQA